MNYRGKVGFSKEKRKDHKKMRCGKFCKRLSMRLHRQWQRACLEKGEYEKMGAGSEKIFCDPWMWD